MLTNIKIFLYNIDIIFFKRNTRGVTVTELDGVLHSMVFPLHSYRYGK